MKSVNLELSMKTNKRSHKNEKNIFLTYNEYDHYRVQF